MPGQRTPTGGAKVKQTQGETTHEKMLLVEMRSRRSLLGGPHTSIHHLPFAACRVATAQKLDICGRHISTSNISSYSVASTMITSHTTYTKCP